MNPDRRDRNAVMHRAMQGQMKEMYQLLFEIDRLLEKQPSRKVKKGVNDRARDVIKHCTAMMNYYENVLPRAHSESEEQPV